MLAVLSGLLTAGRFVLAFLGIIKKGEDLAHDKQEQQSGADAQTRKDAVAQNEQAQTGAGIDAAISKLPDTELDKQLKG